VNNRYYLFHSPPLFCTAGSGGALWVQRDSPDFQAHTHLWARTDLCLCRLYIYIYIYIYIWLWFWYWPFGARRQWLRTRGVLEFTGARQRWYLIQFMGVIIKKWGEGGGDTGREGPGGRQRGQDIYIHTGPQISPGDRICMCSSSGARWCWSLANLRARGGSGLQFNSQVYISRNKSVHLIECLFLPFQCLCMYVYIVYTFLYM